MTARLILVATVATLAATAGLVIYIAKQAREVLDAILGRRVVWGVG